MNNKGQITAEYILIISIILILVVSTSSIIIKESEKNVILSSAQIGAQIGIDKNAYAMYYNDTFKEYEQQYDTLIYPTELKVINITAKESNNTIILKTHLHAGSYLNKNEKNIIGSRANYYIRKTISETFNQKNNDLYYNNLKSNNYFIETEIEWV